MPFSVAALLLLSSLPIIFAGLRDAAGACSTSSALLLNTVTVWLLITAADDNISISINKGAERPYFKRAMYLDRLFCSIMMRFFSKLWLKKGVTNWFAGALRVWLSKSKAYS